MTGTTVEMQPEVVRAEAYYAQGQYALAQELIADCTKRLLSPREHAQVKLLEGKVLRAQANYEGAHKAFQEALLLAGPVSKALEGEAHNLLASVDARLGDIPSALLHLEKAATLFREEGLTAELARVYNNIGGLYRSLPDYDEALKALLVAYDLIKNQKTRSAAINMMNLGLTYADLNNFHQAERFQKSAKRLAQELGEAMVIASANTNLGSLYLKTGRLEAADTAFEAARVASTVHNLPIFEIEALCGLGAVRRGENNPDAAKILHSQALELAYNTKDTPTQLEALLNICNDCRALNEACAEGYALQALKLAEDAELDKERLRSHELLAEIYADGSDFAQAYEHSEAARKLEHTLHDAQSETRVRHLALKFEVEKLRSDADLSQRAQAEAQRQVQERTRDLEDAQVEIVTRLAVAAELRDDDTGEHTKRVGRSAAIIAYAMGLPVEDVKLIYTAARLHDVGKIGISDTILLKEGKLTDAEFDTVKSHAAVGARILADGHSALLKLAETIAEAHHERWDGHGYPAKLAGKAIPLPARIVAVADVIDALSNVRPYKEAWSMERTLAEIKANSGSQFDPAVVTAALYVFEDGPFSPLDTSHSWEHLLTELKTQIVPQKKPEPKCELALQVRAG